MKLLMTGFEPFGGSAVNPSELIVRRLRDTAIDGVDLRAVVLPVRRDLGPARLLAALDACDPDAVLCLGESRRPVLSVERVAVNLLDYRIPDNAGERVVDEPVVAGGPAAYFATLPVRRVRDAIQSAGIPCELSLSAGTFLCNQVMYALLHHLAASSRAIPAGFIHLPGLPEQAAQANPPFASMNLDTMLAGVRAAIAALTDQPAAG